MFKGAKRSDIVDDVEGVTLCASFMRRRKFFFMLLEVCCAFGKIRRA